MPSEEQIEEYVKTGKKDIKVSIDRLTILGDDTGNFETMINNDNYGFIQRVGLAQHPYKRNFYCVDGSLIQWTDNPKFKALRYEFNPNNIKNSKEREHQSAVAAVIKTMKYPRLSRVDVAFDFFGYDLSEYNILDKGGRKKNYWVDGLNKLETLYIGAPNADARIRIYDKAKEQKIEQPLKWWRVELQYRDDACRSVQGQLTLGKNKITCNPHLINLLQHIRIFKPNYKSLENIQERALVKLLLEEPESIKELAKATRSKYKKILSTLPSEKEIDVEQLFISHHDKVLKNIQRYLIIAERNDVFNKTLKDTRRTKEELENSTVLYDHYTESESQFLLESAKMHLLYNYEE